ncbi:recombination regulator RecX [Photobacterium gaetbulicola]|uniref:Regulatory protein RecX n=1 Tax=Photobacterium gaetbulicola Gung47 TaxID=658445 RepID=A0A0C5WR39_9GAMM|nr:recombination regulator RecX [Photobacterium gaetbulicola]AJR07564.1 putative recombination regulator RecX [Photobacterium gaetbulicola Gung47]PSU04476.1 recombination regulator RecX [Photobacterium gaetbulicola]
MRAKKPVQNAKQAAVRYLSRRDHAEQELQQKLLARGYEHAEVDEAVTLCQDYNWLDDARFAERLLNNGIAKGGGLLRIRQEMAFKGIHEEVVSQLFEDDDFDWFEHAREVARRKYGDSPMESDKEKARRLRFMQSRGFDFEQVKYALGVDDEY